jgi:hypothetical protein
MANELTTTKEIATTKQIKETFEIFYMVLGNYTEKHYFLNRYPANLRGNSKFQAKKLFNLSKYFYIFQNQKVKIMAHFDSDWFCPDFYGVINALVPNRYKGVLTPILTDYPTNDSMINLFKISYPVQVISYIEQRFNRIRITYSGDGSYEVSVDTGEQLRQMGTQGHISSRAVYNVVKVANKDNLVNFLKSLDEKTGGVEFEEYIDGWVKEILREKR